jgi:hypothetical protein
VLAAHAPELDLHVVLADVGTVGRQPEQESRLRDVAGALGAMLAVAPVALDDGTPRHDPERLAAAYDQVFRTFGGEPGWQ